MQTHVDSQWHPHRKNHPFFSTLLEAEIVKLFEEIAASVPPDCAILEIKSAPEISHKGVSVRLTPKDSACAQIQAHVEDDCPNVYLWAGQSTSFEMMVGNGDETIPDVRHICEAIIEGKFEEETWSVGSVITKCVGRIELDGKVHTLRYYDGFYPFRKKERKQIRYAPYYVTTKQDHSG